MVSGGSWWARGMAGTGHPSRPSMIRQVPVAVATSLPAPSVIRTAKIAAIEATDATRLGKISAPQLRQVIDGIGRELGVKR